MAKPAAREPALSAVEALATVPEEDVWLASQKSPQSHRAYQRDVGHFVRTLGIRSANELRRADHEAVVVWRAYMPKVEDAVPSTIRRRLAALSSLFRHLVTHGIADRDPVRDVERPAINRWGGLDGRVFEGTGPTVARRPARRQPRRPAPGPMPTSKLSYCIPRVGTRQRLRDPWRTAPVGRRGVSLTGHAGGGERARRLCAGVVRQPLGRPVSVRPVN